MVKSDLNFRNIRYFGNNGKAIEDSLDHGIVSEQNVMLSRFL